MSGSERIVVHDGCRFVVHTQADGLALVYTEDGLRPVGYASDGTLLPLLRGYVKGLEHGRKVGHSIARQRVAAVLDLMMPESLPERVAAAEADVRWRREFAGLSADGPEPMSEPAPEYSGAPEDRPLRPFLVCFTASGRRYELVADAIDSEAATGMAAAWASARSLGSITGTAVSGLTIGDSWGVGAHG